MNKCPDLTGQQIGRWKVIKRVESDKRNNSMWLCQCDCKGENSEKIIRGSHLRDGSTKSCGCLQREILGKYNKSRLKYNNYDLTGEYGVGYTEGGNEFYFDLEDYDLIKNYSWNIDDAGYIHACTEENKYTLMHRIVMNCPNNMDVDHIYHINHDNRKSELRIVTESQNSMNQKIRIDNTSGVKGVSWDSRIEKWQAYIGVNNKRINLGCYNNFEDAVDVRKEAELECFGEFNYKEKIENTTIQ